MAVHAVPAISAISATPLVLDTNIVLDLFIFQDAQTQELSYALSQAKFSWLATAAMREELERVLGYPKIAKRMAFYGISAKEILEKFDAGTRNVEVPAKASATCKDPDDQKFIDLAVVHSAILLSKDQAVLCMAKRLSALGVIYTGPAGAVKSALPQLF
jgi:putative PIN family toxin of toxin-antitoxin system